MIIDDKLFNKLLENLKIFRQYKQINELYESLFNLSIEKIFSFFISRKDDDLLEALKTHNKVKFINYFKYYEDASKFIEDNFNDLDDIMSALEYKINEGGE